MLIDTKGRLFGKVNIIDFIVLLFLIGLIPMLYYGYKLAKVPKTHVIEINWEQKYNEEIAQKEKVFKHYPRLKKYFPSKQEIESYGQ